MRIDLFRRLTHRPAAQPEMAQQVLQSLKKTGRPVDGLSIRRQDDGTLKVSYGHGIDHRTFTAAADATSASLAERIDSQVFNTAINRMAADRARGSQFGW
jgi:hypothetical protein